MDIDRRRRVNALADLLWDEENAAWKPETEWRKILQEHSNGDESIIADVIAFTQGCKRDADVDLRLVVAWGNEPEPERIGRYRVVQKVGSGGMGIVYEVRQPGDESGLRPLVAKTIQGVATEHLRQRFDRERFLQGGFSHRNIVRIRDADVSDEGEPFYVMDYIADTRDGERLPAPAIDKYVRDRLPDFNELAGLFQKVCNAVYAANQEKVIHRDLKPQNVLVTADGEPHILDFGLAKLLSDDVDDGPSFLRSRLGVLVGTEPYMSPEQRSGREVSAATDVYALGVMLNQLLTGVHPPMPFVPAAPEAFSVALRQTTTKRQRRMLTSVLRRATDVEPKNRYNTASELGAAVAQVAHPFTLKSSLLCEREQLFGNIRAHRAVIIITIAAVTSLAAIAVAIMGLMVPATLHVYHATSAFGAVVDVQSEGKPLKEKEFYKVDATGPPWIRKYIVSVDAHCKARSYTAADMAKAAWHWKVERNEVPFFSLFYVTSYLPLSKERQRRLEEQISSVTLHCHAPDYPIVAWHRPGEPENRPISRGPALQPWYGEAAEDIAALEGLGVRYVAGYSFATVSATGSEGEQ